MGGKKKKKRPRGEKRNECVGRRRCCPPPTLSAHCTRDLRVPTGRRRLDGARSKKRKRKKGKNWHQAVVGREKEKRPGGTAGQRGSSSRRTDGCCWGVRSFGSTPSNIIYAPIIFPHVHIRRGRHTMTALLFSSLLSSQCARTEINKLPKKTRGV